MLKLRSSHQISCSSCPVNQLCLGKNLGKADMDALNALILHFKAFKKGDHVFHPQDSMHYLYAVYTGSCKAYWLDEEGKERIHNFYFPGDIIGLESIPNKKHLFTLSALEDVKLCAIPIDALFEGMKRRELLLKRVMNITSYKMQNDLNIGMTTNASQRVADFILSIVHRLEEREKYTVCISFPLSQMDISNFLGMAHETLNRIMRKFSKEKIIKIVNKKIYIIDVDRLKKMSNSMIEWRQLE